MGHTFIEGDRVVVTKIFLGPCFVTQIKSPGKDGYWAVQLGYGEKKIKNVTKPLQGHLKGAIKENKAPRFLMEVEIDKEPGFKVGDKVEVSDIFSVGDKVRVTGVSKGKGFAGVVKRWGFAGGPKTHGQSDRPRSPGSIGQGTTPGRVHKGKKMAGRMGGKTIGISGLYVTSVDADKAEISVSGSVPGNTGGLVVVKKISSGKLEELVHEAPQVKVIEGEEEIEGEVKEQVTAPESKEEKTEKEETKGGEKPQRGS